MPLFYLLMGFLAAGVQAALLPKHWGSVASIVCMGIVVLSGVLYLILLGVLEDRNITSHETKTLIFCIYLVTWFSPTAYVIYQSRADFYGFAISHRTMQTTRAVQPNQRPLFVLLSDLHVTDHPETLEHKPGQGKLTEQLLPAIARLRPRLCIISGDLTDRGTRGEWKLLDTILKRNFTVPDTPPTQLLLVPGNHDLQGSPTEALRDAAKRAGVHGDLTPQILFGGRTAEFYRRAVEWEGELSSPAGSKLLHGSFTSIWENIEQDAAKEKEVIYHRPSQRPGRPQGEVWMAIYPEGFHEKLNNGLSSFNALFPLRYEDPVIGLEVLLLNSSARVNPGASMGLGNLGSEQLQMLHEELTRLRNRKLKYLVVVIHHAPVRRESDQWTWKQVFSKHIGDTDVYAHTFLSLDLGDAQKLMESLGRFAQARPDVQVLVLHGHRHGSFLGRTDKGVLVAEAPAVVESAAGLWVGDVTNRGLQVSWLPASNCPE